MNATYPVLRRIAAVAMAASLWLSPGGAAAAEPGVALDDARVLDLSIALFATHGAERQAAVDALVATGDKSLIPTFVLAMRWTGSAKPIAAGLSRLDRGADRPLAPGL